MIDLGRIVITIGILLSPSLLFSQDPSQIRADWSECKRNYYQQVEKSINAILKQLDASEKLHRESGDVAKLRSVQKARLEFIENGTVNPILERTEYDSINKNAAATLKTRSKELITEALSIKSDDVAETIHRETSSLNNPIVAAAKTRWDSAVRKYNDECELHRAYVSEMLSEVERRYRQDGDTAGVDATILARNNFLDNGTIPANIPNNEFDSRMKQSAEKLKRLNKAIVKSLLINECDAEAKDLETDLRRIMSRESNSETSGSEKDEVIDERKTWNNVTYKTVFKQVRGNQWEEKNAQGKLERNVKFLGSNNEYVEVLLIDRNHKMRLYKNHADIFINGKWIWVANGYWSK